MLRVLWTKLYHFKKHKDNIFEFSPGLNSIIGKNGSGKSSITEAIGLALFNVSFISMKDLISHGEDTATITVGFVYADKEFKIERTIGKVSKTELESVDGDVKLSGNKAVYDYLSQLFEIDLSHVYKNILCINSSNMTALFLLEPSKRKVVFDSIFGFDFYELAWKNLREPESVLEKSVLEIQAKINNVQYKIDSANKHKIEYDGLLEEYGGLLDSQEKYESSKDIIKKKDDLRKKRSEINPVISSLEKKIQSITSRLNNTKANTCYVCNSILEESKYKIITDALLAELEILGVELDRQRTLLSENKYQDEQLIIDSSISDKSQAIGRLVGMMEVYQKEIDSIASFKIELFSIEEELNALKNKLILLNFIRKNIKRIPELLVEQIITSVSKYATEMLSDIMDENVIVTLDNTYGLLVTRDNNPLDFTQLSDGQKVMTAIAVRFAMINTIATNLGIAILDEPTINLDRNHRERLADKINKVRLGQMCVITHDDAFSDGNIINMK